MMPPQDSLSRAKGAKSKPTLARQLQSETKSSLAREECCQFRQPRIGTPALPSTATTHNTTMAPLAGAGPMRELLKTCLAYHKMHCGL